MKTQRFTALILCLFIFLFLLTSCSGYNSQMRNHLTDETNYHSYRGTICDVYYFDAENEKVSLLSSDEIPECDVMIELTFEDYDTVKKFLGGNPNPEWSLDEFKFAFEITKENNQILIENGFYDVVALNTPIEITASSYIYRDSNFFFIAGIVYNDTEYLSFETGLSNIANYVNQNKSLL